MSPTLILYSLILFCLRVYKAFELFVVKHFALGLIEAVLKYGMQAGGISVDGEAPWDIQIADIKEFCIRVATDKSVGVGETYMERVWDVEDLQEFMYRVISKDVCKLVFNPIFHMQNWLQFQTINLQTIQGSLKTAEVHYDLGKCEKGKKLAKFSKNKFT